MRPVSDPVTCAYGVAGDHWAAGRHTGIDYGSPVGTPCFAATDGRVLYAGWDGWGSAYGRHLVVESDIDGVTYRILYAHLDDIEARGGTVETGELVAWTGQTGNVTGPHLHFEVREHPFQYGDDVNPAVAIGVEEEMTEDDWDRLEELVRRVVWEQQMTVTQPSGEDVEKSRERVLRETYQTVKRGL